jgi:hypothetical protein
MLRDILGSQLLATGSDARAGKSLTPCVCENETLVYARYARSDRTNVYDTGVGYASAISGRQGFLQEGSPVGCQMQIAYHVVSYLLCTNLLESHSNQQQVNPLANIGTLVKVRYD